MSDLAPNQTEAVQPIVDQYRPTHINFISWCVVKH